MFVLNHQDGDVSYLVEKAGFFVEGKRLFLSIQCKAANEGDFPDRYFFAIDGLQLFGPLEPQMVRICTNPNDEPPNVYVYTTFHASDVEAQLDIETVSNEFIEVRFSVITEDVNYYDARAKRTPLSGRCQVPRSTREAMWIPS